MGSYAWIKPQSLEHGNGFRVGRHQCPLQPDRVCLGYWTLELWGMRKIFKDKMKENCLGRTRPVPKSKQREFSFMDDLTYNSPITSNVYSMVTNPTQSCYLCHPFYRPRNQGSEGLTNFVLIKFPLFSEACVVPFNHRSRTIKARMLGEELSFWNMLGCAAQIPLQDWKSTESFSCCECRQPSAITPQKCLRWRATSPNFTVSQMTCIHLLKWGYKGLSPSWLLQRVFPASGPM